MTSCDDFAVLLNQILSSSVVPNFDNLKDALLWLKYNPPPHPQIGNTWYLNEQMVEDLRKWDKCENFIP